MKRTVGILVLLAVVNPTIHAQSKHNPQRQRQIRISQSVGLAPAAGFRRVPQKTLGMTELVQVQNGKQLSRVSITTELRTDHAEALQRLAQIANEADGKRTFTQVCGWPALQRVYRIRLAHVDADTGQVHKQFATGDVDVDAVTIAVAAADEIVRLEGVLAPGAPPEITTQIMALSHSLSCPANPNPQDTPRAIDKLNEQLRTSPGGLGLTPQGTPPKRGLRRETETKPGASTDAAQVRPGIGELQIAVSSNGQNMVIGGNSGTAFSNNFGGSFVVSNLPAPNVFPRDGDQTVGRGASGAFYLGLISFPNGTPAVGGANGCADSVFASKDNGQNFNFAGHVVVCAKTGNNICLPDQPQMAVDGRNSASGGGDQLYMTWRNFPNPGGVNNCNKITTGNPTPTISCSTDGGQNWKNQTNIGSGDRARITVGSDGSVYVTYISTWATLGETFRFLMLNKFSSCDNGLKPQRGFPVAVTLFQGVTCPIPGLDRCTADSESSPQPATSQSSAASPGAPDDIYVAYAAAAGNGNENIVVQASHDGGKTWPDSTVANSNVAARRFLPWICAAGSGPAQVTWYDRRNQPAGRNDVTSYFFNQVRSGASGLSVGTEVNLSGSADPQCASPFTFGEDNTNDVTSCVPQPANIPGVCQNAAGGGSFQVCNFPNGACPVVPAAPESCVLGGGQPKYGDYNGNACANGRLYAAWASATPPPWIGGLAGNISIYSDVIPRPAPTVTAIFPNKTTFGPAVPVTITGTNFNGVQSAAPAINPAFISATQINATIPANLPSGSYDVTVATPSGSSLPPNTVNFNVEPVVNNVNPMTGPFAGGTSVTVTGSGFAVPGIGSFTTTHFLVGGIDAGQANCFTGGMSCSINVPPGNPGKVDIQACVGGVCSEIKQPDDQFEYTGPNVSGIDPAHGPVTGGTWVELTGSSLTHGSVQVSFGNVQALQWDGCAPIFFSDTCIRELSPPASQPGPVPVKATVGSSTSTVGAFTYDPQAALATIGWAPWRGSDPPGWVELNGYAPSPDGAVVSLTSSDPIAVVPPRNGVTVPGGSSTGFFNLTFQPTPHDETVNLTAMYAGSMVSTPIAVRASPAITLNLGASELNLGDSTQGTVTINTPAPAGAVVIISSNDPTALTFVPANVPITAGSFTGTFTVTGNYSGPQKRVTVMATYNGAQATDWVNVPASPPPPPPPPCKPKKCPKGTVWVQDDCMCEPPM